MRIFNKKVILYEGHRQIVPLINNFNRSHYIFISAKWIWKISRLMGYGKLYFRFAYFLISIINPELIISKNWVIKRDIIYYLWARKHNKKFIVVQHGVYVGGKVTKHNHRYARCDIFYTWGPYFSKLFKHYNRYNKHCKIVQFGNPIYNSLERNHFHYISEFKNRILLLPQGCNRELAEHFEKFYKQLISLNFKVDVKKHPAQHRFGELNLKSLDKMNIYKVLSDKKYDIIISNYSTTLIDAIYYKNAVLYFDPEQLDVEYSKYLDNIFTKIENVDSQSALIGCINIENQERLFQRMVSIGDNKIVYN